MHADADGMVSQLAEIEGITEKRVLTDDRRAGVCMHLTSLPGPHGIGEIGRDAHAFVEQIAKAGLHVWQFLPTGPTAYGDSPYQPLSSRAGNPMLIELRELVELDLLLEEEISDLSRLPAGRVDYGPLIAEKTILLQRAARRFEDKASTELLQAYRDFVVEHDDDWLHDYALFRTLKTEHNERPWTEWDARFRRRDPDALIEVADAHAASIFGVKVSQFLFYRQWAKLHEVAKQHNVTLFGDMPIYVALDCADAWANREILRLDEDGKPTHVAGVPPDYFSEDGQLWGNPLYDWEYHKKTGYQWWIDRMRHTLSMVDLVRIDHFRGFETYWSIPADSTTARTGQWEYGPNDAIFDALHDALGALPIVAEDLGDITPEVEELRKRQAMPGMSVFQFLISDPDFHPSAIARDSVAYTGTHDNDTTMGWFHGGPGDVRTPDQIAHQQQETLRKTQSTHDDIHWGLINTALATDACLTIVPMQDFLGLGSEARLNTPGEPAGNWQWRLREGELTPALQNKIFAAVQASGR
ncbi:MAG: 4-alpha-glucanotransferase [Pseudomonadota bacterium]